jgi:CheY-like chemotaxis protein
VDDGLILVVDDDPGIRYFVTELLRHEGYAVEAAINGQEALETIARRPVAAMVLDLEMPVLDGPGLSRELARRGLHVPVVLMSASDAAPECAVAIKAAACLPKPFAIGDLLDAVRRVRPASCRAA